jgi:adenylate cyclase
VEAREALEKAISLAPPQFDSYVRSPPRWIRSEDYDHELEGLRKAGWER